MYRQQKPVFWLISITALMYASFTAAQDDDDDNPDDFNLPKPTKRLPVQNTPAPIMQSNPVPSVNNTPAVVSATATQSLQALPKTGGSDQVNMQVDNSILDKIVNKAISIAPSATRKNKINAFTVRLFSTIDSSNDPESGVSSVRTRVVTQTTTTYYTATDDPHLTGNDDLGGLIGLAPTMKNTARVIATQSSYTTSRADFPVTVTMITYSPIMTTGSWTQTVEQTEFKWTKTLGH